MGVLENCNEYPLTNPLVICYSESGQKGDVPKSSKARFMTDGVGDFRLSHNCLIVGTETQNRSFPERRIYIIIKELSEMTALFYFSLLGLSQLSINANAIITPITSM